MQNKVSSIYLPTTGDISSFMVCVLVCPFAKWFEVWKYNYRIWQSTENSMPNLILIINKNNSVQQY